MNCLVINCIFCFCYKLAVKTSQHRYLCNNSCGYRKNLTLSILILEKKTNKKPPKKQKQKTKETKKKKKKTTKKTKKQTNKNKTNKKQQQKKKKKKKKILLQKWNSMQIDIPVLVYQAYSYLMNTNIPTKPYSQNVHCFLFCICGIWINCVQKWKEPWREKACLCHMWTTKAQISLRIRAVCSVPLVFAAWIV